MRQQQASRSNSLNQFALFVSVVALLASTSVAAYRWSMSSGMAEMRGTAYHRIDLFAAAIEGVVNRFAHVPLTILLNPDISALLRTPDDPALRPAVNAYLEQFNQSIGSIAIFVMSRAGVTLAASNWNRPDSFVGEDLSFRPYFMIALAGVPARYYAVGTTRGEPGYFVAHPVADRGEIIGVAVIKIGLQSLERDWLPKDTPAFIADGNGVVILASVPEWRFAAVTPLDAGLLDEIDRTRQYNRQSLKAFPVVLDRTAASEVVQFPASAVSKGRDEYLALTRHIPDTGWSLTLFSDLSPVRARAWNAVALADTATVCLMLALTFLNMRRRNIRQRLEAQAMLERANTSLERKVTERTSDLVTANERLREEIHERERAEKTLRAAQNELVQAAKLAVLGQLATGITHELTQPLTAMRTLSDNAVEYMHRGDRETLEKNLTIIANLVDRMGAIIGPLKSFARKTTPTSPQPVDVCQSVANALFLLNQPLRARHIVLVNNCTAGVFAWCEPVRLEQVLVNLLGNAIDAMAEAPQRTLTLEARNVAGSVVISVADTGPGLPPGLAGHIFEPFFTTKPPTEGLGLGLAISRDIVADFGGKLSARNDVYGGAEFVLELPAPPQDA